MKKETWKTVFQIVISILTAIDLQSAVKKNVLTSLALRICNPHYDAVVNHTLFCV